MANNNTVIPAGLRADIMRKHMESKNTLTKKGSLYIGTGVEYASGDPDYFDNIHCYKTAELEPSVTEGEALVADPNGATGIKWGQVKTAGIENQAIVGSAGSGSTSQTHNSKIFYKSIGNNDIADRVISNEKLIYDAVQIGSSIYKLSTSAAGAYDQDDLIGLREVEAQQFVGGTVTGTTITATNYFNATSDERLKKNIEDYKPENSVLDIPVKQYDYKSTGKHAIGFIAQDLQKLFPELVMEDEKGYLGIQETKLVYLLMLEVKKLRDRIDELEKK